MVKLPEIGAELEYTKINSAQEKWFKCKVIAHEDGAPIVKTEQGYYHRRPMDQYLFRSETDAKQKRLELFDKYTAAMRKFIEDNEVSDLTWEVDDCDRVKPGAATESGFVTHEIGEGYRTFTVNVYVEGGRDTN